MAILNQISHKILLCLVFAIGLSSCFSEFTPDIDRTPVLCMNSSITAGEPLQVNLTRTWRWDESYKKDISVTDAGIKLYVNGQYVEDLVCRENENIPDKTNENYNQIPYIYVAEKYIPASGDEIRLEAVSEKYGTASAVETIPYPVNIEKVEAIIPKFFSSTYDTKGTIYQFDLNLLVSFTDPADIVNYYQLKVYDPALIDYETGARAYFQWLRIDMSNEPLVTEHVSSFESVVADTWGYSFFSDRQISGKNYSFHVSVDNCNFYYNNPDGIPEYENSGLDIELQSLSQNYYNHILSVWEANDGLVGSLGSVGLGEIVPAYSNVSTNAGIVAGKAVSRIQLSIPKLMKQFTDQ